MVILVFTYEYLLYPKTVFNCWQIYLLLECNKNPLGTYDVLYYEEY